MKNPISANHRIVCYRCMKPAVTCVCGGLVKVSNRTGIHIVQHMRERGHAIGTARFAALGLKQVFLETIFPSDGCFRSGYAFPPGTALLYPGENAPFLEQIPANERPSHLAVIDGTWQQASKIYRDSPNLGALPCVTFRDVRPSNYRIRREPCEAANATIEAVCRALKILEPKTPGIDGLLSCFDRMIDTQLLFASAGNTRAVLRLKRFKKKDVPKYLKDDNANWVVAWGEKLPGELTSNKDVLWTWHALRLSDNAAFSSSLTFDTWATETAAPLFCFYENKLSTEISVNEFRDAWHAFLRSKDVLITWNSKSLGRLFALTGTHPQFISLKAAYGNLHRGTCSTLDDLIAKENLVPADNSPTSFAPNVARCLNRMAAAAAFIAKDDAHSKNGSVDSM